MAHFLPDRLRRGNPAGAPPCAGTSLTNSRSIAPAQPASPITASHRLTATGSARARCDLSIAGDRENRELRRANEILRKASAFFAQAELDRKPR